MVFFFQTHQDASQFLQVMTRFTQNNMVNLYATSHVRRTVYQSVPTSGTEKDIYTPTQQETTCLLQNLLTSCVYGLTNFYVERQISIYAVTATVDG